MTPSISSSALPRESGDPGFADGPATAAASNPVALGSGLPAAPAPGMSGRGDVKPLRHVWGEPVRFVHKTERQCCRCGLVQVTRHEPDNVWTEFWKATRGAEGGTPDRDEIEMEQIPALHHGRVKTPACEAVAVEAAA